MAREDWRRFTIPAGSGYRTPGTVHVEGDASSASYFVALGAIAATGRPLRIEGVGHDSIQGDNGNDSVDGGSGNDTIRGNNGNDTISGGSGNDSIVGEDGEPKPP